MMWASRWYGLAAAVVGSATLATITSTASSRGILVSELAGVGLGMLMVALLLRSAVLAGFASLPMLGSALVETGVSDEPTWVRSVLIGCLWYVALELTWESIDRRDGSRRSRAVSARRAQQVSTVVALTLLICVVAVVTAGIAPVRTLALQAIMIGGFLAAFMLSVRRLGSGPVPVERSDS